MFYRDAKKGVGSDGVRRKATGARRLPPLPSLRRKRPSKLADFLLFSGNGSIGEAQILKNYNTKEGNKKEKSLPEDTLSDFFFPLPLYSIYI